MRSRASRPWTSPAPTASARGSICHRRTSARTGAAGGGRSCPCCSTSTAARS
uniref:Uncharacterized protein n=1 Tax=Arundo donax TaxID=35708 RepID=A0A0A8ZGR3_ARUDO